MEKNLILSDQTIKDENMMNENYNQLKVQLLEQLI